MEPSNSSIPLGICKCGCGQATPKHPWAIKRLGISKDDPYDYVFGHAARKPRNTRKELRNTHQQQMIQLYAKGLSTRQIAALLNVCHSYTARILKESSITRTASEANRIRQPAKSEHWRSARQAARKLYERLHDVKLSSDVHVHHVDHDNTNNVIENLVLLPRTAHQVHHNSFRERDARGRYR